MFLVFTVVSCGLDITGTKTCRYKSAQKQNLYLIKCLYFEYRTTLEKKKSKRRLWDLCPVRLCRLSAAGSLRSQRDASGIGDLTFLQVLDQLGQPALGGGVVLQHLGEGAVLQLIWQTLTQGFSRSAGKDTKTLIFFCQSLLLGMQIDLYIFDSLIVKL